MEFFQAPNIDWVSKKWYFIAISILLSTVGIISLLAHGGPRYGIDFRGGTMVQVKFREAPPLDRIRTALGAQGLGEITLQRFGPEADYEILIGLDLTTESTAELDAGREAILEALLGEFGGEERPSWHEAGAASLTDYLITAGIDPEEAREAVERVIAFRDLPPQSGLIARFEDLSQVTGVTPPMIEAFAAGYSLPDFTVRNIEIVGPKVGATLRRQALMATLLGLGSMLVYIAFRFEWIYGLAAVIAVLHDIVIAVGFLSLFDREISLTIIAALLTLVGFSVNDTIVVFDRIRENVRLMRREKFSNVANVSINQTLSRTVLTRRARLSDGAVAVPVRGRGAERICVYPAGGDYRGDLFLDWRGEPVGGELARVRTARSPERGRGPGRTGAGKGEARESTGRSKSMRAARAWKRGVA